MAKWDLSKAEKNHMPRDISDFVWAVSGLTEVIGSSFTTSSDNGRILSWHHDDGYWLTLIMCDAGKPRVLISDTTHTQQYAAIGYCRYHRLHLELSWEDAGPPNQNKHLG